FAIVADLFDMHAAAHDDRAAPGRIGVVDARTAENDTAGREVRTGNDLHDLRQLDRGIVDQSDTGVDHFGQVVRRDVGGHANRDTARSVDEQVRKPRWQNLRLTARRVIGHLEVDSVLVDVFKKLVGNLGQARFGVAHCRWRITIDRTEVTLPVDQLYAQGPVLRHADQRVVNRGIAVRVVFTHHVCDGARRLHIFAVPVVAALVGGIEDAPVDRLEAVTNIRERTTHDHAHGVVEIGALHLLND